MAIFRDLKGRFFSIPEPELDKFRISAADVASCSEAPGNPCETPTIVVNQFFAPVDQVPDVQREGCNDFAAQYGFPGAWGTR